MKYYRKKMEEENINESNFMHEQDEDDLFHALKIPKTSLENCVL